VSPFGRHLKVFWFEEKMAENIKNKRPYVKPQIKTEVIGDASAMPGSPPPGPAPSCDSTPTLPKKVGAMGDGCKVKLT